MRKIIKIVFVILLFLTIRIYANNLNENENNQNLNVNSENITNTSTDSITELREKSEEIKEKVDETIKQKEKIEEELSANLQEIQKLDEKIFQMEKELLDLDIKLKKINKEVKENKELLEETQKKYDNQKDLLEKRLVILYECGEVQYIDVLLKSNSMADFISNYYLITEVISYDTELLENVEKQKKIIETTKEKLAKEQENLVTQSQTQQKTSRVLSNTKIMRESFIAKLTEEEQELQTQIDEYNTRFAEIEAEIAVLAEENLELGKYYIGGVMAWPVPGYTRITSKYGMRIHPITGVYKLHTGIDIGAPLGVDFIAAATGVVSKAEYNSAYGNMVIINHGGGIQTLYAHGQEILVEVGQLVSQGEPILKVGSTGYSTGPHAHFEVRENGNVVNPMPYITTGYVPEDDEDSKEEKENKQNENNINKTVDKVNI